MLNVLCKPIVVYGRGINSLKESYYFTSDMSFAVDLCAISKCLPGEFDYRLQFDFRCAHAAPASGNLPAFYLLLSFEAHEKKNQLDYTSLSVDCRDRYWALETLVRGKSKELHRVFDRYGPFSSPSNTSHKMKKNLFSEPG